MAEENADVKSVSDIQPFDTEAYLKTRFAGVNARDRMTFQLDYFHDVFLRLQACDCSGALDYGTGPAITSIISAARLASNIVLSDYAESNRQALEKWLTNDPNAFDWSSYFDYVVQKLEGKSQAKAREREERLREVVKEVAYCDINADPPVTTGFPGPYDVVIDSGCINAASHSIEEFVEGVRKLTAMLKSGGTLLCI